VDPGNLEAPGGGGGGGRDGGGGGGDDAGGNGGDDPSDDDGSDDEYSYHTDEESDEDEDYDPVAVPYEFPGAPPALIGRTPAERQFSHYLAGPPFDCTVPARRVLYFQQFKSWDAVRDKAPEDLPKLFSSMTTKSFEVLHQETNTYVKTKAVGLHAGHLTLFQGIRAFARHHWLIQRIPHFAHATEDALKDGLNDYQSIKNRMDWAKDSKLPTKLTQQDRFKTHLDQLDSYLESTVGAMGAPLAYITREKVDLPADDEDEGPGLPTPDQELIRRTWHQTNHPDFRDDNAKVWKVIKDMTLGGPFYSHVQAFNASQNGRKAYRALHTQLYGVATISVICSNATTILAALRYTGKKNYPFNTFMATMGLRGALNDRERHGRPVAEADKVDFLRRAIIDEPRHGSTWELTLLNPPYSDDFEASARLVTSAYAPKAQPAESNASQRNIAATTTFAATNNNGNNNARGSARPRNNARNNNNRNRANTSNPNSNSNGNNGVPRATSFDPANPHQLYTWKAWRALTDAQKKIVLDGRTAQGNRPTNRRNNSATNRSTDQGDNVQAPNHPSVGAQMGGRASS